MTTIENNALYWFETLEHRSTGSYCGIFFIDLSFSQNWHFCGTCYVSMYVQVSINMRLDDKFETHDTYFDFNITCVCEECTRKKSIIRQSCFCYGIHQSIQFILLLLLSVQNIRNVFLTRFEKTQFWSLKYF